MIIDPYAWRTVPIQHLELITPDTMSVRVPRPPGYSYQSGQYAIVRATVRGTGLLRQYSFASYPGNDFIEFLIQKEPEGAVSSWFHDEAAIGAKLELSQPFGQFTAPDDVRPLLLIAGRVGVAPFISIIRDHLGRELKRPLTLLYSARGEAEFCYPDLLRTVDTYFYDTKNGARLKPDELIPFLTDKPDVLLCGSKRFVDSLTEQLMDLGVSREHIRREPFTLQ